MHPAIEAMFDEAENRYLKPNELNVLTTYVESLPERLNAYRFLRDQELSIMQNVADQLESRCPGESQQTLERCLKNALLVMRYAAMAMLLNDSEFLTNRVVAWLEETNAVYQTQAVDTALYQLLNHRLGEVLNKEQLSLLRPHLTLAEKAVVMPQQAAAMA